MSNFGGSGGRRGFSRVVFPTSCQKGDRITHYILSALHPDLRTAHFFVGHVRAQL